MISREPGAERLFPRGGRPEGMGESDRCGFRPDLEVSGGDGRVPGTNAVDGVSFTGPYCCARPTWADTDRCLWHAEGAERPADAVRADREAGRLPERLDGANLAGLDLSGLSFVGCSLRGADVTGASLVDADLSRADLRNADLSSADARGATFAGTALEDASLVEADLRGADLVGCRMAGAELTEARMDATTSLDGLTGYEAEGRLDDAAWTYRALHDCTLDAGLVSEAIGYAVRERDVRRRQAWRDGRRGDAIRYELLRVSSRYGFSPIRVLLLSFGVILLFGLGYPFLGAVRDTTTGALYTFRGVGALEAITARAVVVLYNSVYFSVVTFTTVGYGDIYPVGAIAKYLATVESFTGVVLMVFLGFVLGNRATMMQ